MQVLTLEKNRGYLIAGIGAIVALFAFIFLPILSISSASSIFSVTSTSSGNSSLLNVSDIAQYQISIWIEGLAAVTAITIAALIAFRPVPFSMLRTTAPIEIQTRWGNYLLILAGIFGILTPLIITFTLNSFANTFGATASFAAGAWLCLLGMVAVVVGGVLALRAMSTIPQSVAGTYTQYPPVVQPQPWSAPVDPYASVAPPQQWDAGQQGYTGQPTLPSQQQWNTGPQMPPMQQQQWNTGQPTSPAQPPWNAGQQSPPMQQPQWNTGQPTLPAQQQWHAGQPVTPGQQQQWNTGPQMPPTQQQQPPSGPPYQ